LRIDPQKELAPRNWVLGDGQRRSGGNSGEDSPESGRGEQGSGLGPTRVRFVGFFGGEAWPAGGRTGAQRRWPPRLLMPVRWSHGSGYWWAASFGGTRGGRRGGGLVTQSRGEWSSMATAMADRGGMGGARASRCSR
jgi:hypothetical protein